MRFLPRLDLAGMSSGTGVRTPGTLWQQLLCSPYPLLVQPQQQQQMVVGTMPSQWMQTMQPTTSLTHHMGPRREHQATTSLTHHMGLSLEHHQLPTCLRLPQVCTHVCSLNTLHVNSKLALEGTDGCLCDPHVHEGLHVRFRTNPHCEAGQQTSTQSTSTCLRVPTDVGVWNSMLIQYSVGSHPCRPYLASVVNGQHVCDLFQRGIHSHEACVDLNETQVVDSASNFVEFCD